MTFISSLLQSVLLTAFQYLESPLLCSFFLNAAQNFQDFFVVSFYFIYLPGYSSQVSVHQALRATIDYGCHTRRTKPFKLTASQYFIQRRLILRILGGDLSKKHWSKLRGPQAPMVLLTKPLYTHTKTAYCFLNLNAISLGLVSF